jgi:hypothetical protein
MIGISARAKKPILVGPRGPKTALTMSPQQTVKAVEAGGPTFTNLVELPPHYAVVLERLSP